jgi:hypothetical protein
MIVITRPIPNPEVHGECLSENDDPTDPCAMPGPRFREESDILRIHRLSRRRRGRDAVEVEARLLYEVPGGASTPT